MITSIMAILLCLFVFCGIMVVVFVSAGLREVPENEKWVVSRFGTTTIKGPGRFFQIPWIDQITKVNITENATPIQDQLCITKDMAHVIIHMVVYSRIVDPLKYASQTKQQRGDFVLHSSSTLKEIVSTQMLDEVLTARDKLSTVLCEKLNNEINPNLGMKIEKVKISGIGVSKDVLASLSKSSANIPGKCPNCGAPINTQGIIGMKQIKCDYCGFLIKL